MVPATSPGGLTITSMATNKVVVDSSALVALFKSDDVDHQKAIDTYMVLTNGNYHILLLTEVIAETLNVLGKKINPMAAVKAGRAILAQQATGEIEGLSSSETVLDLALEMQLTASARPSFVDCLAMAQAQISRTDYIFGFDATFAKNGYRLPK